MVSTDFSLKQGTQGKTVGRRERETHRERESEREREGYPLPVD